MYIFNRCEVTSLLVVKHVLQVQEKVYNLQKSLKIVLSRLCTKVSVIDTVWATQLLKLLQWKRTSRRVLFSRAYFSVQNSSAARVLQKHLPFELSVFTHKGQKSWSAFTGQDAKLLVSEKQMRAFLFLVRKSEEKQVLIYYSHRDLSLPKINSVQYVSVF